jgi:nucleoid-associated protein YgaU
MGLFDQIKDILTTDDEERAAKAKEIADRAQQQAQEAQARADEARKSAEDWAVKAGGQDPAAVEAQKQAEAAAEDARRQAIEAAEEASRVQDAHDAEVAAAAAKAAAAKAQAATQAAAHAEPKLRTYTVVKGDTLSEIGQRFGVSWRDIAKLNHVKNPDLIYPGQVFKIPND